MFYSHEILTSRKHGIATVWLVATLGSKSSTKKITRKAILDVDVKKACNTILEPDAPMALRLQSNLLYGVSRVYGQQVGYVLSDTIHVEQNLRGLGKKLIGSLDLEIVKVKPAQLMLVDDPAFDPDLPLPDLFLDYNFDIDAHQSQNRDSQVSLSIHSQRGRGSSLSSSQGASIMGLNISSSLSAGGYQLPLNDPFVKSSALKPGTRRDELDDEAILFEDNDLFEIDQDGEIRDLTAQDIVARRAANISAAPRFGSDSAASVRVRKEHDDARLRHGDNARIYDEYGDLNIVYGDDDDRIVLPDAEPFEVFMSGALPAPLPGRERSLSQSEDSSSESAAAPSRPRKPKTKKQLPIDQTQELKNSVLSIWQREYVDTQDSLRAAKLTAKGNTLAKQNALMFVIGNGLNGAGIGIGSTKLPGPLSMFSGNALLAKITGRVLSSSKRQADFEGEDNIPNKRSRHVSDEEIPRDFRGDDEFAIQVDDEPFGTPVEVEIGRDAAEGLAEYPSSAMMPWNLSASQRARSSSLRPASSLRLGSRGVSASPLVGRGNILPGGGELEKFSSQQDVIMYGRSDDISTNMDGQSADGTNLGAFERADRESIREFEMFGPAANVDTQTAGQSQWARDVMDTESENFFEFVRLSIAEKYDDDEDLFHEDGQLRDKKVGFEELFNPATNSEVVAAQAFLHILSLATKGKIWVDQDEGESMDVGGNGLGGEIWLTCL
ncbi:putative rad21 rec8 n terminal domain-containing protein [Botrytis fragariae]|uniref:Putative rad21 rec8 n terminal domain-containing protein n=1 Tax=Botrytis fragariae TaxID=1964551 RepID=A0A8H6EIA3_9HELO|nr:putative rad21 rec8 n terminal domain-containing protein [Botrytis fragariae]KAF5873258.1 putative rad21 rec8 n terminal domain-containing protein [Botrytis fragariae]